MPDGSTPRVLIVDDNLDFRSILGDRLKSQGFSIIEDHLETLAKIVEAVRQNRFDAIILDIHMPGLNGFDVLKAIRKVDLGFPALVLTGSKNSHSVQRAMELGCKSVFEKPCDIKDLVQELQQLIESHSKETPLRKTPA